MSAACEYDRTGVRGSPETIAQDIAVMATHIPDTDLPSVSRIAGDGGDSWKILVSTILSLRTRDSVTLESSRRLLETAPGPEELLRLSISETEALIYPVSFFRVKAGNLHRIAGLVLNSHGGRVPDSREALLSFPGVGLKTANLVLGLGYGQAYLCVDTHVHRIANRLGWIQTRHADQTEAVLSPLLAKEDLVRVNELMVLFGQRTCKPVGPLCSECPLRVPCPSARG